MSIFQDGFAQEICVFKSSRDTLFCPADGWVPDEHVQLEQTPDVRVEATWHEVFDLFRSRVFLLDLPQETAPYRWGTLLFQTTPAELRPHSLQTEVQL